MKPMARKRLMVDVIERRQICFRLGQSAIDLEDNTVGVIAALTSAGALLQQRTWEDERLFTNRWFVEYRDLRPYKDGRRYSKEVRN